MSDIRMENLKKRVLSLKKSGYIKSFPEDIKRESLALADEFGARKTFCFLGITPCLFYNWKKSTKITQNNLDFIEEKNIVITKISMPKAQQEYRAIAKIKTQNIEIEIMSIDALLAIVNNLKENFLC